MSARRATPSLRVRIAAVVGVVVFLVLVGTVSVQAYWTAVQNVSGQATAATPAVTIAGHGALATTHTTTSTGPKIAAITLGNTGTTDVTMALSSTATNPALAGQISLRLWVRSGATCPATVPATGVTTGTLAAPPALPTGATSLAAGGTVVICAAASFTGTYASYAGQTTTATLTLTGTLPGTTWTATATGAVTQNLQAASAPTFSCTTNGGNVSISWNNTATAVNGTVYRSRINGTIATQLADRDFYYREYSNQGKTGTGLPNVAGIYPWNIEETTNGVTTTAYAGQIEVYFYTPWDAWAIRCV